MPTKVLKRLSLILCLSLIIPFVLTGCSSSKSDDTLYVGESFAYSSLDAHKEYYGWCTSIYGVTETLFKIGDDREIEPWIAEKATCSEDGLSWTITLKNNVCFSNGVKVDADSVIANLKRLGKVNTRFSNFASFDYEMIDEFSFTIRTKASYPTLLNDLTSPETAILDLENTEDFDEAPIATGPFVVKSFESEGTVEVEKNENYWDGEVKLEKVVFYYMPDDDTRLMAMQNGEIDCYSGVTAAAKQVFEKDSESYKLKESDSARLQFYTLNKNRLSDNIRKAIMLGIDRESIASYLSGSISTTSSPFSESTAYAKSLMPSTDKEAAKAAIESDGYKLNSDGIYEKDGKELRINICYYASRSLDSVAILMNEQLTNLGFKVTLTCEEDPDATYISSGDYDIALYCMISDKNGDPYYFIDTVLRKDGLWSADGFNNDSCETLINQLQKETDTAKRADFANEIISIAVNDHVLGTIGFFKQVKVMDKSVSNINDYSPFDFYLINANTEKN